MATNSKASHARESTPVKDLPKKPAVEPISPNYRPMLLAWARQQCQGYPGIYIDDFTGSWRNGRAFLTILHRHKFVT